MCGGDPLNEPYCMPCSSDFGGLGMQSNPPTPLPADFLFGLHVQQTSCPFQNADTPLHPATNCAFVSCRYSFSSVSPGTGETDHGSGSRGAQDLCGCLGCRGSGCGMHPFVSCLGHHPAPSTALVLAGFTAVVALVVAKYECRPTILGSQYHGV